MRNFFQGRSTFDHTESVFKIKKWRKKRIGQKKFAGKCEKQSNSFLIVPDSPLQQEKD